MRMGETRYLLQGRFRALAWVEWGSPTAPPVVCVHGLTRNGRDFDPLAMALAADFRVIAPDLPGRGRSEWLAGPQDYTVPNYVAALSHLLAAIDAPVGWVGTSLGGLCGMALAACPGTPVARLVVNDIGPSIAPAALARIGAYMLAAPERFDDGAALEAHLRRIHAPFGRLSDAQWAHLARHSSRALPEGGLALHYDPAIAAAVAAAEPVDPNLWSLWDAIAQPRLVIRGTDSDLLDPATFARMATVGAQTLLVPDAGHAPALMDPASIAVVRSFLLGEPPA